jgi:hypothetical protein
MVWVEEGAGIFTWAVLSKAKQINASDDNNIFFIIIFIALSYENTD